MILGKDLKSSSQFERKVIDGIAYNNHHKKSVLFKDGKLIDPIELNVIFLFKIKEIIMTLSQVLVETIKHKKKIIRSKPITINVSDLPNPPPQFKGAVGNMSIKSK